MRLGSTAAFVSAAYFGLLVAREPGLPALGRKVSYEPQTDSCTATNSNLFDHLIGTREQR